MKRNTLRTVQHLVWAAHHPLSVTLHKVEHSNNPVLIEAALAAEKATAKLCEIVEQLAGTP